LLAAVSDETGTGSLVFATSPTLVTPALGTPASGVVTNLTGTASININGTVGATTASTGAFTTLTTTGTINLLTVGRGAGAVATNTAVGASALSSNTTGGWNTAVGQNSLVSNLTANNNAAFGQSSLNKTTAGDNSGFGANSLGNNTSGAYNTAIGSSALISNTTASYNVANGYRALYSNQTGASNTAVGGDALYTNTASFNTAVGQSALEQNSSGANNTAQGYQALKSNTTASNNTAVGYQAGYSNTTGAQNAFFGTQAGYSNTGVGSDNTAMGYKALFGTTTGTNNVAVGSNAGVSLLTGTQNTFLGRFAGNATTSSYNTFVGDAAGYLITSGEANTILGRFNGNQNSLDIRTASNYIVLSDGGGNPRGIFDGSGNFLVGATSNTYGGSNVILCSSSIVSGLATSSGYNNTNSTALEGTSGRSIVNHINGTASGALYIGFGYNGGGIGSITQSGTTAVLYNVTSDQRLKENIQDADSASSLIDSLQVRKFDWKTDNTHQHYGFVAQELVTVAPEAVHQPADTEEMMAVDYSKLVPMLVKEVQSLRKRLADAGIS
jgi:hypothetical protein